MRMTDPDASPGSRRLFFALLGCAGLAVLALCVATGIGVFLLATTSATGEQDPLVPSLGPNTPLGGSPTPPPKPPEPAPRLRVAAVVTRAQGPVRVGTRCLFDVQLAVDETTACRAQIVCGEILVYGGGDAGYFPCVVTMSTPPSVEGRDEQTTSQDGDAAMLIDTAAGALHVQDDARGAHGAFVLDARIEDAR